MSTGIMEDQKYNIHFYKQKEKKKLCRLQMI